MPIIPINYRLTDAKSLSETISYLKTNYHNTISAALILNQPALSQEKADKYATFIIEQIANGFTFSATIYLSIDNTNALYCEAYYSSSNTEFEKNIFWQQIFNISND